LETTVVHAVGMERSNHYRRVVISPEREKQLSLRKGEALGKKEGNRVASQKGHERGREVLVSRGMSCRARRLWTYNLIHFQGGTGREKERGMGKSENGERSLQGFDGTGSRTRSLVGKCREKGGERKGEAGKRPGLAQQNQYASTTVTKRAAALQIRSKRKRKRGPSFLGEEKEEGRKERKLIEKVQGKHTKGTKP